MEAASLTYEKCVNMCSGHMDGAAGGGGSLIYQTHLCHLS